VPICHVLWTWRPNNGQTANGNGNGHPVGRLTTSWTQVDRQRATHEKKIKKCPPPPPLQLVPPLNEAMPNKKPHSPQPLSSALCGSVVFFWGVGRGLAPDFPALGRLATRRGEAVSVHLAHALCACNQSGQPDPDPGPPEADSRCTPYQLQELLGNSACL
jgi:hypothetical protein